MLWEQFDFLYIPMLSFAKTPISAYHKHFIEGFPSLGVSPDPILVDHNCPSVLPRDCPFLLHHSLYFVACLFFEERGPVHLLMNFHDWCE